MISLQNFTPDIYYKESRDFQFIGRLFDLVLNSVKTEADCIYSLPLSDVSNEALLTLIALTLGFKPSHRYTAKQLNAICKVFPLILKQKGSIQAVITACNAIFHAEGLSQALSYDFVVNADKTIDHTKVNLYIPQEFGDITIISDLLDYILPAGMTCNIIKELRINTYANTEIAVDDAFKLYTAGDEQPMIPNDQNILYNNDIMSSIAILTNSATDRKAGYVNTGDAIRGLVKDNPGFISNSSILKFKFKNELPAKEIDEDENKEEQ